MFRTIVLLILFCPIKVLADTSLKSCLSDKAAAQILWRSMENSTGFVHPLQGKVQLVARKNQSTTQLSVRFDPEFTGVSLPYNLYAVLVIHNGAVAAWWDYTQGCKGPGLSFFSGREIDMPPLKMVGGASDQLQIMVWGKF